MTNETTSVLDINTARAMWHFQRMAKLIVYKMQDYYLYYVLRSFVLSWRSAYCKREGHNDRIFKCRLYGNVRA